ncbi:TetR family transcriptional regulator [Sinirhodobacter populi]|uniref:TetR family transcriptional regulator n=1 Tax=Paenirhodobacter populi TaxID=2306993 RepID=A0A443KNQ9_9RHOB|nr:TetR family transcriptional regulator [Sinirhodobacter populi]RWR34525.1 TetR family transcriptional regulator [Sinirhodobacter populi]
MTHQSPPTSLAAPTPQPADADADAELRDTLLAAGLAEFARYGLDGARLERIAERAGCAKRMVYYYFGDKKAFYLAVLDAAYQGIRASEEKLNLDTLEPRAALHLLARNSFRYHEAHADFTRLVLVENLQGGAMLQRMQEGDRLRQAALAPLERLLLRGAETGAFRPGLKAEDVHYLISALCAFRVDHAETWEKLLRINLLSEPNRTRHLDLLLQTLDAFVCPPA